MRSPSRSRLRDGAAAAPGGRCAASPRRLPATVAGAWLAPASSGNLDLSQYDLDFLPSACKVCRLARDAGRQIHDQVPGGGGRRPAARRATRATPRSRPRTCCWPCSSRRTGFAPAALRKLAADVPAITDRAREAVARPAHGQRRRRARGPSLAARSSTCSSAPRRRWPARGDEYISVGHLLLALADKAAGVADILPDRESLRRGVEEIRGPQPGHLPERRGDAEALEKFGRDLTADARARQARPGHRPRRGDPPGDPGALAADEEQPGADRRARASARPRSSRASRSGSSTATCPSRCATGA